MTVGESRTLKIDMRLRRLADCLTEVHNYSLLAEVSLVDYKIVIPKPLNNFQDFGNSHSFLAGKACCGEAQACPWSGCMFGTILFSMAQISLIQPHELQIDSFSSAEAEVLFWMRLLGLQDCDRSCLKIVQILCRIGIRFLDRLLISIFKPQRATETRGALGVVQRRILSISSRAPALRARMQRGFPPDAILSAF